MSKIKKEIAGPTLVQLFIMFWLGVLTGALIIGFWLFRLGSDPLAGQANLFYPTYQYQLTTSTGLQTGVLKVIPTPPGNYTP